MVELDELWSKYPDQRLGQLLENALRIEPGADRVEEHYPHCIWNRYDDETLKALKEANKLGW